MKPAFTLRFRTKLLLVCASLVAATTVAMMVPLYWEARSRAIGVYRERLMAVAHGASVALHPDTVALLRQAPTGTTIPYLVVRRTLREFAWRDGDTTRVRPDDGLALMSYEKPRWRMIAHADWTAAGGRPRTEWTPPPGLQDSLETVRAGASPRWWFVDRERLVAVVPTFAGTVPIGVVVAAVPRETAVDEMRAGLRRILWFPAVALGLAIVCSAWLARQLTRRVERLATHARVLASGDLRQDITEETRDEFGVLARALHELASHLRGVLSDVHTSADAVHGAVQELALGSQEMHSQNMQVSSAAEVIARSTTVQTEDIRSISALASTAADAADAVRNSAGAADDTAGHIANAARRVAEETSGALERMNAISAVTVGAIPAVAELERKSRRIAAVANAIAQLANQANLLSINAAIEAARAGAQGRGFSVVADEVRELAQSTTSALDDIRALATDIEQVSRQTGDRMAEMQRTVSDGEAVIQSSALAVQHILVSVEMGRAATGAIVEYAASQHARATSVSAHVNAIADVAAENACTAQQVTDAVRAQGDVARTLADSSARLGEVAEQLRETLVRFRL